MPVGQLQSAIDQLEPVGDRPAERACLRDLRKLLKKYKQVRVANRKTGH